MNFKTNSLELTDAACAPEEHLSRLSTITTAGILLTLPLTQLFTINLGFPLKIYEVCIFLWVILSLVALRMDIFNKSIFFRGILFFIYALVALFIVVVLLGDRGVNSDLARYDPLWDGVLKSGYILLCVLGFNLVAFAVSRKPGLLIRFWLWGAAISALIHLYLFAISAIGLPIPNIPGMKLPLGQQLMELQGFILFRAGTFLEGNYAGPFFVLSFLIAVTFRRFWFAILFLAALITSFSTIGYIAFAICIGYMLWKSRKSMIALYVTIAVIAFVALVNTPVLNTIFTEKFIDSSKGSSFLERQESFLDGWRMFLERPMLGVGVTQFGMHTEGWSEWAQINGVSRATGVIGKGIPNSVYAELLSEFGLVGIGFFILFLFPILRLANQCSYPPLKAGILVMFIFWIASPTFTFMYYWIYLAVVCGLVSYAQMQSVKDST